MRTIEHWIAGTSTPGSSDRTGAVFNPATGQQQSEVCLGSRGDVRSGDRRGQGRLPRLVADFPVEADKGSVRFPRAGQLARRGDRGADHRRARQGALRRARGGAARARGGGVRVRDPHPAEGRLLRPGIDRRGLLLVPGAARCGRGHHAVQLPGDGPDVDVPCRHRLWQHVRAQAQRTRPLGVPETGRAVATGWSARRRLQRRPRGQGRRRHHPRFSGRGRGVLRGLDPDRQVHPRARNRQRQTRAGPRRGQEPRDHPA